MGEQLIQEFNPLVCGQRLFIIQPPKFLYDIANNPKTSENTKQIVTQFIHDITLGE